MKLTIQIITYFSLFFLFGCKTNKLTLAISTLNKIEPIYNEVDAILYKQKIAETKKASDSCEKYKLNCLIHFLELYPEYKGGITKFREAVFKDIKIPKSSKPSKFTVNFVLGRNDSIEQVRISGSEDKKMINEISRVLKIDSFRRNWTSGSFFQHKIKYEYEFDIELLKNNIR